jgi:alpha-L-rhamnosidase
MANNLRIVARFAGLLGDEAGARRSPPGPEAGEIFNRAFYDPDRGSTATAPRPHSACHLRSASSRRPIDPAWPRTLPRTSWPAITATSRSGLLGIQWLMQVLADNGYPEVAYLVAAQTSFPSWGT